MHYVYILKSLKAKDKLYVGLTGNLERRLKEHDETSSDHYTYRHRPWKLETYISFQSNLAAKKFEAYLKTGSGRAFIRRHLI